MPLRCSDLEALSGLDAHARDSRRWNPSNDTGHGPWRWSKTILRRSPLSGDLGWDGETRTSSRQNAPLRRVPGATLQALAADLLPRLSDAGRTRLHVWRCPVLTVAWCGPTMAMRREAPGSLQQPAHADLGPRLRPILSRADLGRLQRGLARLRLALSPGVWLIGGAETAHGRLLQARLADAFEGDLLPRVLEAGTNLRILAGREALLLVRAPSPALQESIIVAVAGGVP